MGDTSSKKIVYTEDEIKSSFAAIVFVLIVVFFIIKKFIDMHWNKRLNAIELCFRGEAYSHVKKHKNWSYSSST